MKKLVYTFFCIIIFFVSGCDRSNKVDISSIHSEKNAFRITKTLGEDGSAVVSQLFPVNSQNLLENGVSEQGLEVFKFYLASYINALIKQIKTGLGEGGDASGVLYYEDLDALGFVVEMHNEESGNVDNSANQNNNNSNYAIRTDGFFVKKVTIEVDFPVVEDKGTNYFLSICKMAFLSMTKDVEISNETISACEKLFDEALYIYDYATVQTGISSNIMYQENGLNHNVFVESLTDIKKGKKIEIWTYEIDKGIWYIIATIFAFVVMLVLFIVVKFKKKKC